MTRSARRASPRGPSAAKRTPRTGANGARVVRLRMPSRRAAVAPTVDKVLAAVEGAGLGDEQRDDLAVAVAEALSNAAVHGNGLDESRMVRVVVHVVPRESATVEVHDSGPGFDASSVSDPTDPARVLIPGGRGVFLMRRLVDTIEFNAAGNVVRLTMRTAKP